MKILYVTDQRYRSSGVSVFCVELCDALINQGEYVMLALQRPDYPSPYPVVHNDMLTTIQDVLNNGDKFDWDVVHINGIWNWPYHKVARIAYKRGIPVVWSPHGSLTPWALNHKWLKKKVAWLLYMHRDLARANVIHVTAPSEVADMRRLGFKNDVAVLPLGVKFRWNDNELRNIKERTKSKTILFVSRIHPKKGIDNLIRAWAELKRFDAVSSLKDWKIKIIGEDAYPGCTNSLKRLCAELGVRKDVEFCGAMYGDAKDMFYAEAKIFVLPSHSENFGSVVVEALANGTPVITTKATPWQGLEDRRCGWWIEVGVKPLVDALRVALKIGETELLAMGARGREWMKTDYDWAAIARKMYNLYLSMINGEIEKHA